MKFRGQRDNKVEIIVNPPLCEGGCIKYKPELTKEAYEKGIDYLVAKFSDNHYRLIDAKTGIMGNLRYNNCNEVISKIDALHTQRTGKNLSITEMQEIRYSCNNAETIEAYPASFVCQKRTDCDPSKF